MITVKVTYTVKPEFAAKNQENITMFMKDFTAMGSNDFRYSALMSHDCKTFVHISMYKNSEIQAKLLSTPSFVEFQKRRDESGLEGEPSIEVMTLAGTSHEIF